MIRQRLPNRRSCESFELRNAGPGSPIEAIARDADLETIRAALTRDHDGGPATLLGAALDALAEAPR
jgi:hypothetical protein